MDWDNLKFFLALAETGSLSRASEKLRVDHSTVSRRIEMLEQDLGVRVVERLSRSYRLTTEGEQVRDRAKEIETRIADIARFANSMDQSSRVVRVSGPPSLLSQFLAPRLLPLQRQQPGLRIELVGETRQINVGKGEADLALRMVRPSRKGWSRGNSQLSPMASTGRAIISPVVTGNLTTFSATTTASITCRNSVG
jgi:DNA-binding transcriptional LysR family regulator